MVRFAGLCGRGCVFHCFGAAKGLCVAPSAIAGHPVSALLLTFAVALYLFALCLPKRSRRP
jgi:hypothetical protein